MPNDSSWCLVFYGTAMYKITYSLMENHVYVSLELVQASLGGSSAEL